MFGFTWAGEDRIGGPASRGSIIVGLNDSSAWLGDGGRIFHGGGDIHIFVQVQRVFLGACLHEVLVCEVGVLQGARD